MSELLRHHTRSEFVTIMISESGLPQEYRGVEGFREALLVDGAISQAGCYLDQRAGLEAAGIDPHRR
ncbi:MAG: hypothetical protein ACRDK5_00745 [Solirubrobacterales bacterium]